MINKFGLTISVARRLASAAIICLGLSQPALAQTKIRVAATISTDLSAAALGLALKNGDFKKAGLDVELKSFVQSNQKYDAFKGGAVDIDVNMGAINAGQLYSSGVPMHVLRAVTPADIWAVVVKKESVLSKPGDFKGKRFGVVSLSGTNYGTTYLAFKTENVDLMRDVKVSTLPPSALVTALEKGEVDGATLYEPYLTNTLKNGRVKIVFRPGDTYQKVFGEPFIGLVISARKDFVAANREAAKKFVAVMENALASLPDNLDRASHTFVEVFPEIKSTPAEIKEMLIPYVPNIITSRNDPAFVKKAQNLYDRLLEAKQIRDPVKASEFWISL